ncbi:Sugar phosphate permease [Evansella caseinilytica]|uniref:Sugar phosphate permease n=1 Tax=Evansella caseinilytica TaxID=1503961 RepID=A0A1H3V2H7_9BACI|nr:MFS transporter [Evansella caseinilytica]SDZ68235.1 Sugar phosphate permease [Evansella caseinilytica]
MAQAVTDKKLVERKKESSVFKEWRFVLLFATTAVSSFSVSFFMISTNWYVVNYLGLEAMLGFVMFASSVPRLIFMLLGGVIADRMSKPWIMFISDFTKGILLVGVLGLFTFDVLSIWVLIGLALMFGILDAFFYPASNSLLPSTVKPEQLTRANSVISMTNHSSQIVGPLLAGVLLTTGGYGLVFGVTAAALLLAGLIDIILKRSVSKAAADKMNEEPAVAAGKRLSVVASMKEGLAYVKNKSFLLALMASTVFLNLFFTGPLMVGLPLYATTVLSGSAVTYSFLNGGISAGMLVGTLIIGVLNIQKKRGLISVIGILFLAMAFLFFSLSAAFWLSMVMIILIGMAVGIINVPLAAVIQKHTDKEYLGRVMSLVSFSSMGLVPVSYLMTSLLLGLHVSVSAIMTVSAACLMVVSLVIMMKAKALRTVD